MDFAFGEGKFCEFPQEIASEKKCFLPAEIKLTFGANIYFCNGLG